MTEPIVRHGGIFCEDLQVKTRHSWIHHLHSTRNICWLCWWWLKQLATLSVQSVSEWMMFSLESLESLDSLHLICWFSVATYTTYTDCGPSELMLAGWFVTGWNQCNGHSQPRVPRHIVLNWPRPAYICQYHHQWSGLLGWDLLLWSTLPHLSPFLISSILSHWSIQQIPRSEVISRKLPLHSLTVSI